MEPLVIPKSKKIKGLTTFCYRCKTNVSDTCRENGKPLKQCRFGEEHVFKVYSHEPGSKNKRRTKKLETRNIDEAQRLAIEFHQSVKQQKDSKAENEHRKVDNKNVEAENNKPELLIHCCAKFLSWLKNESVPMHLQRERSEDHLADIEFSLKDLLKCLKENGYNISSLKITDIDDQTVGVVYDYLLKSKGYSNRTFNKHISFYRRLFRWYTEEYNHPLRNSFSKVKQRKTNPNPQAITETEFNELLKVITSENGIKEYHAGVKAFRNFYRPYLKDAFKLGMLTGRRRQEIISMKFSDIINDPDGFSFIRTEDFKVNHIQDRRLEEEKKFISIPITQELNDLLLEIGLEKYRGTDKYILAPEITNKRTKSLSDDITRGFSHFYDLLGTGKHLTFKSMRKSYITSLSLFMGGNAKAITGHGGDAVIEKFYLNKKMLVKAATNFQVFNKEVDRKQSIEEIRNEKQNKNEINIEK